MTRAEVVFSVRAYPPRWKCGVPIVLLLALIWCGIAEALTAKQSEDLTKRYLALGSVLESKDYRQAVKVLTGLVRDFGNTEYEDELRFGLAEAYFNLGEYARARNEFLAIVDRPRHSYIEPEAMYGYAISSIMIGAYSEAEAALQQALKRQGYDADPRMSFAIGVLRYYRKEYDAAIARLQDDSLLEATLFLGKSLARVNRPRDALLAFRKITSTVPGTPLATLAHFAAGEALFINGDFEGARAKFRFFLDNFPDSPLSDYAHFFYGCALIHNKQYDEALNELLPLTRHPNNVLAAHANYFVGYCNLETNHPKEAVTRFQRVRANYPKTRVASYANLQLTQALLAAGDTAQTILSTSQLSVMFTTGELQAVGDYLSGVLTMQIGQFARAANFFENILIRYPNSTLREPACALLLQTLNVAGNYERAVTVGAKYVRDFADSTSVWRSKLLFFLGEGYYYLNQFGEAENCYRQSAQAVGSSDIAPYARLGQAFSLMQLDRNDESIRMLRGLINAKPADTMFTATALLGLGYGYYNKGQYDTARASFEYILEHYPGLGSVTANSSFYAGMCYRKLGYPGDAIDAWQKVVSDHPDNPKAAEAGFRAGDTYFKGGEYDKAISMFRFVTERYPYSTYGPPAQAFIGQAYYNKRWYKDALREHQKFLDLYPNDAQAQSVRRSLEMDYYRAGLEDSSYMEQFVRRYPESEMVAQARFDRALQLMAAQDYANAVLEFQTVIVNFPGSSFAAKAQINAAECYTAMENWRLAADAYKKYLDYYPTGTERAAALFNLGVSYFKLNDFENASKQFQAVLDSFPTSEHAENAKKNLDISRKRLGIGGGQ